MNTLLSTLIHPQEAAQCIKSRPQWLVAFLILATVSTVTYALVHPYLVQETLSHLPSSATNSDKQVVIEILNRELPAKLAFYPIRLLAGWAAFSLTLLYICRAFAPQEAIRFRQILSLEVHTEVISVVANIVTAIATVMRPNSGWTGVPFSAVGLVDQVRDFTIKSLLASLNLFTLWQFVILAIGVSTLCGFGRARAILIVLLVWILFMLFNLGAMKVLQDELHLLL